MSKTTLRWIAHHPIRWIRAAWFHWAIAAILLAKAILVTDPLWQVTALSRYWPIALGAAAAMAVASSVALADERLQTFTSMTLLGIAIWRIATYVALWAADTTGNVDLLAQAFALHWGLLAVVATRWPTISTRAALIVTVEAGRDQETVRAVG